MAREQEILCEELAQFVNVLEGRTDLGVADAKRWTLKEWMTTIFPVRQWATGRSSKRLNAAPAGCLLVPSGMLRMRAALGAWSQIWLHMTAVDSLSEADIGLRLARTQSPAGYQHCCLTLVDTLHTHVYAGPTAWPASQIADLRCSVLVQKYTEKVKVLVKQGMQDPSGPALAELESLMSIRVSRAAFPRACPGASSLQVHCPA